MFPFLPFPDHYSPVVHLPDTTPSPEGRPESEDSQGTVPKLDHYRTVGVGTGRRVTLPPEFPRKVTIHTPYKTPSRRRPVDEITDSGRVDGVLSTLQVDDVSLRDSVVLFVVPRR